jgi:hypothetical protein
MQPEATIGDLASRCAVGRVPRQYGQDTFFQVVIQSAMDLGAGAEQRDSSGRYRYAIAR